MKRMLLVLAALYPWLNPTLAEAGAGCSNACSVTNGISCVSQGLGCNTVLMMCQRCVNDLFCTPGGTCNLATGECMIDCSAVDGGVVDGGGVDSGLVDLGPTDAVVGDTGDVGLEAGVMDAMPPVDTGPQDVGPPDNGSIPDFGPADVVLIDKGPGGGRPPLDPNRGDSDDCQCSSSKPTNNGWWLTALLAFVVVARRRRG